MAEVREGQLLIRKAARALLALLLVISMGGETTDAGERRRHPVFFQEPDPQTARRIEDAIDLLKRTSATDHTRGRDELEAIGYWAVKPLRRILREGKTTQPRNAALALGNIGDFRALPDLLWIVEHEKQHYTPAFAALMVGKFGDPATLKLLRRMIRDTRKDPRRIGSVLAVTKIGHEDSFDILVELLRTETLNAVREPAIFSLGFFRNKALVRVPGQGRKPIDFLEKAYRSSDKYERRAALLALALLGHRDLRKYYEDAALNKKEDPDVRRIALLALGRFPDEDVTKHLLATLKNHTEPGNVRLMAAMLLKDRQDPGVLDELLVLNFPDAKLRAAVTLALSNFDTMESMRRIARSLNDREDKVRAAAAIALSRMTVPEGKALAIRAMTDILQQGALDPKVRFDMQLSRKILRGEDAKPDFLWVGNEQFAKNLPKDVEERILDFVNWEVERVVGISSLTDQGFRRAGRWRQNDETSELRDLEEYLVAHPYFEPQDIPEPKVAITPKVEVPDDKPQAPPRQPGKGGR